MIARVRSAGAPRDLGLDQGRACRAQIRARAAAALPPSGAQALARDLSRHFPHLAERCAGLARGAGLRPAAVLGLLQDALAGPAVDPAPAPGGGIQLEVALEPAERGLCVRSAVPDGGHPYVALTQAGLAACFAGVNACGLAAAGRVLAPPEPGERCRAPGLLLVDQCLERLDNVEAALEWCERRPGGGRARLLFADASGAVAALEVEGEKRLRCDPTSAAGAELEGPCGQVRLDPGAGALELLLPDAEPERFEAAHSR